MTATSTSSSGTTSSRTRRPKQITRVALDQMEMVALGETPNVLAPEVVVDLLPYLTSTGGYVLDKVEGLAIAADGDDVGVDGQ